MDNVILNLIVIRAANLEKSVKFYQMLGLNFFKHRHGNGVEHFSCELGQIVFEIYPQKNKLESTKSTRLGFKVANLKSLFETLKQEQTKAISEPKQSEWGLRAVVSDPDGHKIELTQI